MKTQKSVKSIVKKVAVFAVLIAALSGAVYLNWQYSATGGSIAISGAAATGKSEKYLGDAKYVNATVATTPSDYFTTVREKRESDRKKSLSTLNGVLNNVKSNDEAKVKASDEITRITKNSESEQSIEALIIAKGFEDCVAVMGEDSISVVVKCSKNGLLESETRQIQDIVSANSEISLENIKIIEIK